MIANIRTIKEDGVLVRRLDEPVNFYAPYRNGLREHPQAPREQPSPQRASQKASEEKNQWQDTTMTLKSEEIVLAEA